MCSSPSRAARPSAQQARRPAADWTRDIRRLFVDQSALHGVLAEVEALSLDLLEVRQLEPHANHRNKVTAAHLDGR